MKQFLRYTFIVMIIIAYSCQESKPVTESNVVSETETYNDIEKIKVLNFGTFHMGFTTDANTTEFDENNKENQKKVHEIAKQLSSFKPTVIVVETIPENDNALQKEYEEYLNNPDMFFQSPSEIELLAFELGRISDTKRVYGIDHKMGYNYMIAMEIENQIDSNWINQYYKNPMEFYPEINKANEGQSSLLEKLINANHDSYLDFLIAVNADMLTHAGTHKNFEGADEAAKYYQRNLRMYSNLNRIPLEKDDRVFILMGASHTAFFRDFMSRSPKYQMVNTLNYLK